MAKKKTKHEIEKNISSKGQIFLLISLLIFLMITSVGQRFFYGLSRGISAANLILTNFSASEKDILKKFGQADIFQSFTQYTSTQSTQGPAVFVGTVTQIRKDGITILQKGISKVLKITATTKFIAADGTLKSFSDLHLGNAVNATQLGNSVTVSGVPIIDSVQIALVSPPPTPPTPPPAPVNPYEISIVGSGVGNLKELKIKYPAYFAWLADTDVIYTQQIRLRFKKAGYVKGQILPINLTGYVLYMHSGYQPDYGNGEYANEGQIPMDFQFHGKLNEDKLFNFYTSKPITATLAQYLDIHFIPE